jgi:hypothetical protein
LISQYILFLYGVERRYLRSFTGIEDGSETKVGRRLFLMIDAENLMYIAVVYHTIKFV